MASQQQSQEHSLNSPSSRSTSYLCAPTIGGARGTHADFLLCTSWDQSHDRSVYCKTADCSLPKLNRFYKMEPKKSLWNGHSNCQQKRVWAVTLFISLCSRFSLCFSNRSSNLLNANCAQWRREVASGKMLPRCLPMNSELNSPVWEQACQTRRNESFTLEKAIWHCLSAQSTCPGQDSEHQTQDCLARRTRSPLLTGKRIMD